MAVRFVASDEHRITRLSQILGTDAKTAAAILKKKDREQREFFKKAFGRKEASPYEFDLVINFDYIKSPAAAARVVATAFKEKFRNKRK
jgi:cytidylate kinase